MEKRLASSPQAVITVAYRMVSCAMEIHHLCLLLLCLGLKTFHFWVRGAKPPLTASSTSFNITLIFHLWLLIQSLITNKHSVNVAIIASSPRLDYLLHPSFTITTTGKRGFKWVSVDSIVWETLGSFSYSKTNLKRNVWVYVQTRVFLLFWASAYFIFAYRVTLVIKAPLNSHLYVNKNDHFSFMSFMS